MSEDQLHRPIQRFYDEVVQQGRMERIDELISPDFVDINPYTGARRTAQDLARDINACREAISNIQINIEGIDVEGDLAIVRTTLLGDYHEGLIDEAVLSPLGLRRVPEIKSCQIALRFDDGFEIQNGMISLHKARLHGPGLLDQLVARGLIAKEGSSSAGDDFDLRVRRSWDAEYGGSRADVACMCGVYEPLPGQPPVSGPLGRSWPTLNFEPLPGWPPITEPPGPIDPETGLDWQW
jgi:hypothetical protein